MSNSLWPHGLYTVHGIPQARTLEWVAFPFSRGWTHVSRIGHKGSQRILKCVAYPFSSGSSRPRNQTGVSYTPGGFFTNWGIRKAPSSHKANTIIRFTCTLLPQLEAFVFLLYYLFCTKVAYYIYIAPCFFSFHSISQEWFILTYINWSHYFKKKVLKIQFWQLLSTYSDFKSKV